jgi:large subunit ribosomal protein L32
MGLPKRRTSKSRRDKRRTGKSLTAPSLSTCPDCGEPALPHHACPSCGSYKGRKAVPAKED